MEILAQVQPLSNSGLQIVIAGVVLLLTIAGAGVGIWSQLRRKPPIEAEFVSRVEWRDSIDTTERHFSDVGAQVAELRRNAEATKVEIIDRINEMQSSLNVQNERRASEMWERLNGIRADVASVKARIERT